MIIPFDRGFSEKSAEEFVQDVLVARLGARTVSVENFRFGKSAKGTAEFLASHDEFETRIVSLVEAEGETISSSHIRGLVAAGEVRKRPSSWALRSSSKARSCAANASAVAKLGMPTANLVPDDAYVCPGHGVYAATAYLPSTPGQPAEGIPATSTSACARPSRPGAACSSRRT